MIEIDQMRKKSVVEMIYNYRWHSARFEQNKVLITRRQRKVRDELKSLENKINVEKRVNEEIVKYVDITRKQIEIDIEEWSKIYERDVNKIDGKTLRLEAILEEAKNRIEVMQRVMEEKEEEINDLKVEKVARDAIIAEEQKKEDSVLMIQSWWRGCMVRWEFGKYEDIMKKKFKKKKEKPQQRKSII